MELTTLTTKIYTITFSLLKIQNCIFNRNIREMIEVMSNLLKIIF